VTRDRSPGEPPTSDRLRDPISESAPKPLSSARETWDPGLSAAGAVTTSRRESELPDDDRVLSHDMTSVGYEMVERGPLAPGAPPGAAAREPVRVIEDPDHDLVRRWQAGDEGAFEQLVRLHEKKVFRLLLRMMGNREEAEDVAQETFLSLHRHGHRFRGDARFSTFVYRVASNAALNRRRTLGRNRARIKKLAVRQAAGDDLPQGPRDPEDAAIGSELSGVVRQALETLKPSLRLPVVLYDIEGLSYREIADVLGVAEGTVKSRIHRARLALRAQLVLHGKDTGPGDPGARETGARETSVTATSAKDARASDSQNSSGGTI
jgi:RNA polymerase sigma-70 factor (ECF subfamily)